MPNKRPPRFTAAAALTLSATALLAPAPAWAGSHDHDHLASPDQRIASIQEAHGSAVYHTQGAVKADLNLNFGPMHLTGPMTFTPSLSQIKLELQNVGTLAFDHGKSWTTPADAKVPGPPARFHVVTWPYFAAAPFKLADPGANASDAGVLAVTSPQDRRQGTKITFDSGVGDAPDDWYIAFTDDQGRMDALAYIVTFGKDQAEAEKQPSIILYSDFINVDGVEFATQWTFHFWNPETGVVGEPKGRATLDGFKFVQPTAQTFPTKPTDH